MARFSAALGFISFAKKVLDLTHQLAGGSEIVVLVKELDTALGNLGGSRDAALDESVRILRRVLSAVGGVDVKVSQVGIPSEGDALKLVVNTVHGNRFCPCHNPYTPSETFSDFTRAYLRAD